jgi:hypothetical protein
MEVGVASPKVCCNSLVPFVPNLEGVVRRAYEGRVIQIVCTINIPAERSGVNAPN